MTGLIATVHIRLKSQQDFHDGMRPALDRDHQGRIVFDGEASRSPLRIACSISLSLAFVIQIFFGRS
ncbi:MAG: hypothetical protein NXI24_14030 [bacterium]|nr:hypothetical protein [bacterium]